MRNLKSLAIFILLAIMVVTVTACSTASGDEDSQSFTQEQSQESALDYLINSPTFLFDGIEGSVELTDVLTARCPQCWIFVYEFDSSQAGYGDRTGQMLAQVITTHTARITIDHGKVVAATMDDQWDMMNQVSINNNNPDLDEVKIGGTPGSCGFVWDVQREGWHRPWDPDSFIPAAEVPGWIDFIPTIIDLEGKTWVLDSIGENVVIEGSRITVEFTVEENGTTLNFAGSAGCNRYFGSAEITKDGLVFGPIGSTEMWCADEGVMDQEYEFLKALGTGFGYQINGNTLEINYDEGKLVFISE